MKKYLKNMTLPELMALRDKIEDEILSRKTVNPWNNKPEEIKTKTSLTTREYVENYI